MVIHSSEVTTQVSRVVFEISDYLAISITGGQRPSVTNIYPYATFLYGVGEHCSNRSQNGCLCPYLTQLSHAR